MPEPDRLERRRAALIAYDVCRRALTPLDPARKAAMRPVLDAWVEMIAAARASGVPVIYTTPVSRVDGADVVMLPTDLSAETGVPPLTNAVEGTAEAGFPDDIAPRPEDYVFLKRRPSAFYGTGVAELLHMLRRDTIIIGRRRRQSRRRDECARGLQPRPRIRRGARMLLEQRCGRPRLQPRQSDENVRPHPKPRPGHSDAERMRVTSQPTTQRLGGKGAVRNRRGGATRTGLMTEWAVLRTVVLTAATQREKHRVATAVIAGRSHPDRVFNSTWRDWPLTPSGEWRWRTTTGH